METETSDKEQSKPWLFKKGQSGNPTGRPKGSVGLKTWAKEYLASLTDEERMEFMDGLPKIDIWKMAEGNPANQTDLSTLGQPIVFMPAEIAEKNGVELESDTNTSAEGNSAGHNEVSGS